MNKHSKQDICISIAQLLEDTNTKHWIDNTIGVLDDYKKQEDNTVEKPIGTMEMAFQSEKHGLVQIVLEIQILEQSDTSTFVRICVKLSGMEAKQEVYVEVDNGDLKALYSSPFIPVEFKPLAQENENIQSKIEKP